MLLLIFVGVSAALLALVLHPVSSLLTLLRLAAFAVGGVCGFALWAGGPPEIYLLPCGLGITAWVALLCVRAPRLA